MSKITQAMHEISGLNPTKGDMLMKALAEAVDALLTDEGECNLPGIGKIKRVQRAARTGRNPATGEEIHIPPKVALKFVPAKALVESINN